jgi:hypothetical protein
LPSAQAKPLHASSLQQELLQKMAHRTTSAQRLVKRAHIILEALNPRDAQRDATWEEARKQETEHMEINEAAAEGEKISSLQNTIPYGML